MKKSSGLFMVFWGFNKDDILDRDIDKIKNSIVKAVEKIGATLLARVNESFRERLPVL